MASARAPKTASTRSSVMAAARSPCFAPSGLINPAAFNYPQWLAWGRDILEHAGRSRITPSERLIGQSRANLVCLEEAWISDAFEDGLELEGLRPADRLLEPAIEPAALEGDEDLSG